MKARQLAKEPSGRRTTRATANHAPTRVMKGKSPKKYGDIQRDLERQRTAILEEAGVVLTNRAGVATFPDVSDQATAEMDQNFSLRIKDRERKLLKKIDEALARLDAHIYGICEQCGGEIPYKRLKARPVTTLCIECKTLQEEREKSRQ